MNEDKLVQKIEKLEEEIAGLVKERKPRGFSSFLRKTFTKTSVLLGIGITALFTTVAVYALTKPYDFVDGTVISAAEVNADFDLLYTMVNQIESYVPIAMGVIEEDGTILGGTGNFTVTVPYDLEITIAGYTLNSTDYVCIVTPAVGGLGVGSLVADPSAGHLRVAFTDQSGYRARQRFSFVVHRVQ
jgi:hypothetical protein